MAANEQELDQMKSLLTTAGVSIVVSVLICVILSAFLPWMVVGTAALVIVGVIGFLLGYHSIMLKKMPHEWTQGMTSFLMSVWVLFGLLTVKGNKYHGAPEIVAITLIIPALFTTSCIFSYIGRSAARKRE